MSSAKKRAWIGIRWRTPDAASLPADVFAAGFSFLVVPADMTATVANPATVC